MRPGQRQHFHYEAICYKWIMTSIGNVSNLYKQLSKPMLVLLSYSTVTG